MLVSLAFLLLALSGCLAQNNATCCSPSYVAQAYNALLNAEFEMAYDSTTGNTLLVSAGANVSIFTESATGRVYSHIGKNCTFQEFPQLKGVKSCVQDHATFVGEDVKDGIKLFGWSIDKGNITGSVVVTEQCIPKVYYATYEDIPRVSRTLYNIETDLGGLAVLADFDTTVCNELKEDID